MTTTKFILETTCAIEVFVLLLIIWSVAFPAKRVWPAPSWASVKFWVVWICIVAIFLGLIYLAVGGFNTWQFNATTRYFLGLPISMIGILYAFWGIGILGTKNTLGIQNKFITRGPYQYCCNPQYMGDILLLIGAILFVNARDFNVPAILAILGFWLMPLPEEGWLKERYGAPYQNYLNTTSRFI